MLRRFILMKSLDEGFWGIGGKWAFEGACCELKEDEVDVPGTGRVICGQERDIRRMIT